MRPSLPKDASYGRKERQTWDDGAVDHVTELVSEPIALWKRHEGLQVVVAEVEDGEGDADPIQVLESHQKWETTFLFHRHFDAFLTRGKVGGASLLEGEKMAARMTSLPSKEPDPPPFIRILIAAIVSMTIQGLIFLVGYSMWPSLVPVPRARDFDTKAVYTLRCLLPPLLVLAFAIVKVAMMRFLGYAKNPLGKDELILKDKNFLHNTLEQFTVFLLTTGALMTYLEGEELRLIPLYSFVFVLGRILFRLGYPRHRSVGFTMTIGPSVFLGGLTVYFMFTRGFAS